MDVISEVESSTRRELDSIRGVFTIPTNLLANDLTSRLWLISGGFSSSGVKGYLLQEPCDYVLVSTKRGIMAELMDAIGFTIANTAFLDAKGNFSSDPFHNFEYNPISEITGDYDPKSRVSLADWSQELTRISKERQMPVYGAVSESSESVVRAFMVPMDLGLEVFQRLGRRTQQTSR